MRKAVAAKAFRLFSNAGFEELRFDAYASPEFMEHPGHPQFTQNRERRLGMVKEKQLKNKPLLEKVGRTALEQAETEWDDFYAHPGAFRAEIHFLVGGKVPLG